ncbi:MAG: circadian phase modifier CpmA [Gammaproteobacteria bacterium]|nr:circadian phase modifier CpmA [Gammaproteobacteria bacterium]
MNEVNLDFDRENRTGLAEAVFCQSKSLQQLQDICARIRQAEKPMLFTKLDPAQFEQLQGDLPAGFLEYNSVSQTAFHKPYQIRSSDLVAVVTGGSSDVPVAREASRTLRFYGHETLTIDDAGVAGLWRITEKLDALKERKIVICIAGMDAALPTVLGGLIPASIIAVPTSVGYGMARNGETALHALLVSCAPGLVVVNIDNGYGAACAAIRMLNGLAVTG